MNVFCDPVSIRMRAWHLVVGLLAVTSAVCISVFVCVVVLAKVVIVDVTMLLFCGFSWFSCFLLESRLGLLGSQDLTDRRMVFLSAIPGSRHQFRRYQSD